MSAVVMTWLTLQASPMMAAAWAFSPAAAIITTRSALAISSIRFFVRPARSVSHSGEKRCALRGANADAVKKVARVHARAARCLATRSLDASSAMTLTLRGCELGASMRNLASAAVVARAHWLIIVVSTASHRRVDRIRPHLEMLARGILERLVGRQDHGGRAHALVHRIDAGRDHARLGQRLGGAHEAMARHDDAVVGRHQVLLGAVDDRPHALLQRRVLHGKAFDAAIGLARLLRRAIHQ